MNHPDDLYKDPLKDYEESPPKEVWERIESSLDKKKKRRVLPIWWQLGGVAALVAVIFGLFFIEEVEPNQQQIVDQENDFIKSTETVTDNQNKNSTGTSNNAEDPLIDPQQEIEKEESSSDIQITDSQSKKKDNDPITTKKGNFSSGVAETGNANHPTSREKGNFNSNDPQLASSQNRDQKKQGPMLGNSGIQIRDLGKDNQSGDGQLVSNEITKQDNKTVDKINEQKIAAGLGEKESSLAIQENEEQEMTEDQVAENKEDEKPSILDAVNKDDPELDLQKDKSQRWTVGPSIAPIYSDGFGNGSSIHSSFSNNDKSGNINMSYGLNVSYALNDKLTIRTGIHKTDYSYDTNGASFAPTVNANFEEFSNIDFNEGLNNIVAAPAGPAGPSGAIPDVLPDDDEDIIIRNNSSPNNPLNGTLIQQLDYIEVPMELQYSILEKPFNISLIGGVSSLFLIDNSLDLESQSGNLDIGSANNANEVNFSTNLGIGVDVPMTPKLILNIEPTFKYQLNTFSNSAGNFNPYTIGVYSGVKYKFN